MDDFDLLAGLVYLGFVLLFAVDIVKTLRMTEVAELPGETRKILALNLVVTFVTLVVLFWVATYFRVVNELNDTVYLVILASFTPFVSSHTQSIAALIEAKRN